MSSSFEFAPIATIRTPFSSKFGVPRQSLISPSAWGIIEFEQPFTDPNYVEGIKSASHLWIQFVFDQVGAKTQPTVRPPRLGGNKRIGVLATRSTHRPNPIGLSVVKLDRVVSTKGCLALHVSGVDLVDRTPILDIKPYVPYCDSVTEARYDLAPHPPKKRQVVIKDTDIQYLHDRFPSNALERLNLIEEVLRQDPRPAYKTDHDERIYSFELWGMHLKFKVADHEIIVVSISLQ